MTPPWWQAALTCRSPACGPGLRAHDTGDGPAVLVFFLLATVVIALQYRHRASEM